MNFRNLLSVLFLLLSIGIATGQNFRVQILHHNDGESELLAGGDGYGGAAQFKGVIDSLRWEGHVEGYPTLLFSSGDNFLAGKEFDASLSLPAGTPYYDGLAMSAYVYDAIVIGNHDFDFGPDVLAQFINSFDQDRSGPIFLSANLDFSGESSLDALVGQRIAKSTKVWRGNEPIGVIGLTTPNLPFISAPGNVTVDADLVSIAQAEIDAFTAEGVNKIILISHLQGREEEQALVEQLSGVDIVIAGGGGELLANDPSKVIPGDEEDIDGAYPIQFTDKDGNDAYLVTTSGDYRYLGNLIVTFDADGRVIEVDEGSGPVPVIGKAKQDIVDLIETPIAAHIEALNQQIIGSTEVALDGRRNTVRGEESNEGNLIADAVLWLGQALAAEEGTTAPMVALMNGGGIRNNNIIEDGSLITAATTFDMLPFGNKVTVVGPVSPGQFKLIMENAVSRITPEGPAGSGTGRFAQVAGFKLEYALDGTPVVIDGETDEVTTEGNRVVNITLMDGEVAIVSNGAVVAGAPDVYIATADFLARGGDQYPYGDTPFTIFGSTGQQALARYIAEELNGEITIADYPEGGEGRIMQVALPDPTPMPTPDFATVKDAIYRTNLLQILEQGVKNAGLASTLEGEALFTVFAPINNAFAALDSEALTALFADPNGSLRTTLLQHVVSGQLLDSQLSDGQVLTSIEGKELTVRIKGGEVFINNAKVIRTNLVANNGVVHLIMSVIE